MLTVHHLNNSRSQRVLWLLEELGVPYELKFYQRDPTTMLAPASLKAIHPLGKSPVVTDGELTLAESGAIVETLLDRYGEGRLVPPRDSADFQRFRYWLHYAEGSAMSPLLLKLVFDRLDKPPMPFLIRPVATLIANGVKSKFVNPQLALHINYQEAELAATGWFAGPSFTAADIQMSFPLEAAAARSTVGPHIKGFLERITARPAYQRALERGGPYALMG